MLWCALSVTLLFIVAAVGPEVLRALVPRQTRIRATLSMLEVSRWIYVALVIAIVPTIVVLAVALLMSRNRPAWRRTIARGLVVCVATAIGMVMAEGAASVWLASIRIGMPWLPTHFNDAKRNKSAGPSLAEGFADPRGDRTIDIIELGGSSAHGDQYDRWFSTGAIVAWKLGEVMPDCRFSLHCLARPGIVLEQVHESLEVLRRRPDLAIIYAGHNEFSMRHDWARDTVHYRDTIAPLTRLVTPPGGIPSVSSVCRLIDRTLDARRLASPPVRTLSRRLVDVPLYTPNEYARILREFRVRIEAMTSYCERVGARVVLVIPPGNDADFEPSRSFLPPETPRSEREAFAREVKAARRLEQSDPEAAMAAYRDLIDRQPGFAETHYRLARLEEQAGHPDEANRHYILARDCDGMPARCMSDFQDVYREVAARHPDAILIDGPAVFRRASPRGVVGENFINDVMHPSLIGFTTLARAILDGLHARHALGWPVDAPTPAVTPVAVAEHYGMTPRRWAKVCRRAALNFEFAAMFRFDPSRRLARIRRLHEACDRLRAGASPDDIGIPGIGTRILPRWPIATAGR